MSLEGDFEQVFVQALVVVFRQFGVSVACFGVAAGGHGVLERVGETHLIFGRWGLIVRGEVREGIQIGL